MANIKISELNPLLTVQDADVIPIVDNAVTKKVTAAILRTYTQGNSVLLTGAQTIAGIKTFTSQLASSVATGTAPFSVASTTKVTNLNADLLDGLSSAAFQGALTLTTTGSSGASTLNTNTLNVPNYTLAGLGGVPYTGATTDLNLDTHDIYTAKVWLNDVPNGKFGSMELTDGVLHFEDGDGHSMVTMEDGYLTIANASTIRALLDVSALSVNRDFAFPNASGTLALTSDLNAYVPTTRTVSTTSPLTGGGALSSNLTLSIPQASGSVNGYLSSANWTTFNGKQNAITLTTTGTSGAATLVGSTLNIPNYADTDTGITSLNGLTALTQTFAVGTSGTDFGITSATSTHTFNLPTASATNRGALSSADWTTFNNKQNALTNPITGTGTTNYLPKFTGASALGNSNLISDANGQLGLGVTPSAWDANFNALQIGIGTALYNNTSVNGTFLGSNFYYNGTDNKYIATGTATAYGQINGSHNWFTVASGTAGDTVNFTQAMTLNASGQLGIGTTTPAYKLDVNGTARVSGIVTISNGYTNYQYNGGNYYATGLGFSSNFNYSIYNTNYGREDLRIEQATGAATFSSSVTAGVGSTISGAANSDWGLTIENTGTTNAHGLYVNIGSASTGIPFRVDKNNSALFNIANTGAATFSSSVTTGAGLALSNATAPASGIEFPATQVASASANNLDDYEEGTWTMGISFGNGTTGITYSNNTGTYTKIGRQVTVNGYLTMTNKGTSTGAARITGLPFNIANTLGNYTVPSLWFADVSFINQFEGYGNISDTTIDLLQITNLGVASPITDTNFVNNSRYMVTLTYFV